MVNERYIQNNNLNGDYGGWGGRAGGGRGIAVIKCVMAPQQPLGSL